MSKHKYLPYLQVLFVTVLLLANLVAASKVSQLHGWEFGSGLIFFPLSYLLGDVLTEVYGYSVSRRIIWTGFGALLFSVAMIELVLALPPSPNWHHQREYEIVFGMEWRIAMASMIAYASGEFMNAFVMAKMKIATAGRFLWTRTIGSTILGELVDTLIFYPIAFLGNPEFPLPLLATIMVSNYLGKVGWEVVATPATYLAVGWLKQAEGSDPYDRVIDFSPLAMS